MTFDSDLKYCPIPKEQERLLNKFRAIKIYSISKISAIFFKCEF